MLCSPWGRADGPLFAGRTACVFRTVDISVSGRSADAEAAVSGAVELELRQAGFDLTPEALRAEKLAGADPASLEFLRGPSAAAAARAAGADLAVTSFFSIEEGRILFSVSCYDTKSGLLAAGFVHTSRYTLALYTSVHAEISRMLSGLVLDQSGPQVAEVRVPSATLLPGITFTSPMDGMEVLLAGEKSAGSIAGGKLEYPMDGARAGAPLAVEKRRAGYHTARQTTTVESEVPLTPLARKSWVGYEVSWTLGQMTGAGGALRLSTVPDWTFFAPSLYLYTQLPGQPGGMVVLHTDFAVLAGQYLFFPPDSPLRMGVSAGIGAIFTGIFGAALPVYSDLYLDLGNIWIELNLPGFSIFFREEMKYTTGVGLNLLGRRLITVGGFLPPLTLGVSIKG